MKKSNLAEEESPRFVRGEAGSFTFDTGALQGVLRQDGQSIGLVPMTYTANGMAITTGEGLLNHYRVFIHRGDSRNCGYVPEGVMLVFMAPYRIIGNRKCSELGALPLHKNY